MLAKSKRLHTAADFRRLRRQGTVWRSPSFIAQVKPTKKEHSRLGIIVTTKIGKAVIRKRASRVFRHAFAQTNFPHNLDIILIARPVVKGKTSTEVSQELAKMVKHLSPHRP